MKYSRKHYLSKIAKILLVLTMAVLINNKSNITENNVTNINLNIKNDLASLNILNLPIEEETQVEEPTEVQGSSEESFQEQVEVVEEPVVQEQTPTILGTYTGKLTGYVYNCPGCSGKLACDASLDLSNGNVTYNDTTYGNVNIVAASSNLACGSIIEINSSMSDTPMLAIVLDRGVKGTTLDLLTPSVEYAINNVGNRQATYNVLRNGY